MSLADEVWRLGAFRHMGQICIFSHTFEDRIRPLLDELEQARKALEAARATAEVARLLLVWHRQTPDGLDEVECDLGEALENFESALKDAARGKGEA